MDRRDKQRRLNKQNDSNKKCLILILSVLISPALGAIMYYEERYIINRITRLEHRKNQIEREVNILKRISKKLDIKQKPVSHRQFTLFDLLAKNQESA